MRDEESIFAEALGKASEQERSEFLDRACAADAELRRAVEALLEAQERGRGILDSPPELAETLVRDAFGGVGAADTNSADLPDRAGTTVGRYKLLQQIAEGGMGIV